MLRWLDDELAQVAQQKLGALLVVGLREVVAAPILGVGDAKGLLDDGAVRHGMRANDLDREHVLAGLLAQLVVGAGAGEVQPHGAALGDPLLGRNLRTLASADHLLLLHRQTRRRFHTPNVAL